MCLALKCLIPDATMNKEPGPTQRGLTWFSKSCIQLKQLEDGEGKFIIIRFKK